MDNMVEARRHLHEMEEKKKVDSTKKTKKIRNFFFGCCKNK